MLKIWICVIFVYTHTDSFIPYYNIIIARATRAIMTGRSLQADEGSVFSPLRGFAGFFAFLPCRFPRII